MASPHSGPEDHSRHSVDDRDHLYDDHDVPNTDDDTDADVDTGRSKSRKGSSVSSSSQQVNRVRKMTHNAKAAASTLLHRSSTLPPSILLVKDATCSSSRWFDATNGDRQL